MLIKCPECGNDVSDFAEQCIHCGFPLKKHRREYFDVPEYKESLWTKTGRFLCDIFLKLSNNTCARCNSHNINMTYETMGEVHTGRVEARKKSIVTRAGNKAGRAGMIMATGGLWALTPKKSKYNDVYKERVRYEQRKIYTCMNCGYVWYR